jgi:MFS family permease
MVSLIIFTIDIFIQKNTDVEHTGSVRGLTMTATNTAWVMGPFLGGMLVIAGGDSIEGYRGVYIAGFALLLPLLYLVYKNFHNFKDPEYIHVSAIQTISRVLKDRDISRIFVINIVLQTFYAWMAIYVPIYLHDVMYFNWGDISLIFTIMLIPFVILNIPLGKLADGKLGEKEIMAIGFFILGISTASLVFLNTTSLMLWTLLLFVTRIGAAAAETMIETYFFKKVDGKDPEVLSIFRITRSLSFFVAPLIVTLSLVYTTEKYLFVVFGVICLLTLYPILTIRDTN